MESVNLIYELNNLKTLVGLGSHPALKIEALLEKPQYFFLSIFMCYLNSVQSLDVFQNGICSFPEQFLYDGVTSFYYCQVECSAPIAVLGVHINTPRDEKIYTMFRSEEACLM